MFSICQILWQATCKSVLRMYIENIRFGVLMVNVNFMVICDTYHKNGSRIFLKNIDVFLQDYMGLNPSKQ